MYAKRLGSSAGGQSRHRSRNIPRPKRIVHTLSVWTTISIQQPGLHNQYRTKPVHFPDRMSEESECILQRATSYGGAELGPPKTRGRALHQLTIYPLPSPPHYLRQFSRLFQTITRSTKINTFKSPSNTHPHTPNVPRSITAHERARRKTSTTATKESRPLNIHQQHHPTNTPTPNQQWQTTRKPLHLRHAAPHDHAENRPQIPRSI